MPDALTISLVFEANSLNYGEGIANIAELKKIHRSNGDIYTYASRQSLSYDIARLGNELFQWNLDTVDKASGVVQFRPDVTIADATEMDLFGYLKTQRRTKKRAAVVRLSHAVSLEPFRNEFEFITNMGLAERIDETSNPANVEQHQSLYTYTVTVDLHGVGVDPNDDVVLAPAIRARRVTQLLDLLKILNRHIRGRQETLAPLFAIGGVFPVANPFYLGRVGLDPSAEGHAIHLEPLTAIGEQTFAGHRVGDFTWVGYLPGVFTNEAAIQETFGDRGLSIEDFFSTMTEAVHDVYARMEA